MIFCITIQCKSHGLSDAVVYRTKSTHGSEAMRIHHRSKCKVLNVGIFLQLFRMVISDVSVGWWMFKKCLFWKMDGEFIIPSTMVYKQHISPHYFLLLSIIKSDLNINQVTPILKISILRLFWKEYNPWNTGIILKWTHSFG